MKLLLCLPLSKSFVVVAPSNVRILHQDALSYCCQDTECRVANCDFLQCQLYTIECQLVSVHVDLTAILVQSDVSKVHLNKALDTKYRASVCVSDLQLWLCCASAKLDVHLVVGTIECVQVNFYRACDFGVSDCWRHYVAHV